MERTKAYRTFRTAQDAMVADDAILVAAIYILPGSRAEDECINGYDAIEVVYADRDARRIRYGRRDLAVVGRLYGCGVNRVRCAFLDQ